MLAVVLVLSACGGSQRATPCSTPALATLYVTADTELNIDEQGQSLPVVLRLLQVTDPEPLDSATFDLLWQQPTETLGPALVRMTDVTIYPGDTQTIEVRAEKRAHFLGIMGIFREPAGRDWLEVLRLKADPLGCRPARDATAHARVSLADAALVAELRIGPPEG